MRLVLGPLVTATLALGVALAACGGDKTAEPDRVVNVLWKCELLPRYADTSLPAKVAREGCKSVDKKYFLSSLLEVTIRTPQGGSYIITFDPYTAPGTYIKAGDPWVP